MGLGQVVREGWSRLRGLEAEEQGDRKTALAPAVWLTPMPWGAGGQAAGASARATPASLRRFAETPVARRAINAIKDRIACMEWRVEARPGCADETTPARVATLRRALEGPNASDSFRTLIEPVIEDLLVVGTGAIEVETTGNEQVPVRLYPVDATTIEVDSQWSGQDEAPRFAQRVSGGEPVRLLDRELVWARLNPRTHSPWGLGKLQVAFDSVAQFLEAHRYAGKLAANSVPQYALWAGERTPEQAERLMRWWQDDVEGSGRVPVLNSADKPEVLRFANGTDADLRLAWQEFLLRMIANAFDLPAMVLGVAHDVNRSTAAEMADDAFQSAVVPLARLLAEHLTRDVCGKALGWADVRFVWNDLDSRDEAAEVAMQVQLLGAGVLTVNEVRAWRGLGPLAVAESALPGDQA